MSNLSSRESLDFKNEAKQEFDFLSTLDYELIDASETILRYQRADIEAIIYHGRQSYEVSFEITRSGCNYSLSELIRIVDVNAAEKYRNGVATTFVAVQEALSRLHDLVAQYAMKPLCGDPKVFDELDRQRESLAKRLELETAVLSYRPRAEEAFRRGNYAEAIELYKKIELALMPSELMKVDIARRRLVSQTGG